MPARLRDFIRVAEMYGFTVDSSGGKHNWRVRRPGARVYTLPAHNGSKSELSDPYINAFCRQYELDRDEFWQLLRGELKQRIS